MVRKRRNRAETSSLSCKLTIQSTLDISKRISKIMLHIEECSLDAFLMVMTFRHILSQTTDI